MTHLQRLLLAVLLAVPCFFAAGCIIPYAYQKLSYLPGCDTAGVKAPEVRAFRVDVDAHEVDMGETGEYTIAEITARSDGKTPSQASLSLERGYYVLGGAVNFNVGWLHTTRVRLYAPGYHLVELKPWESPDAVRWQLAGDWVNQAKAVDDLLRRPAVSASEAALRGHDPSRGEALSDLVMTNTTRDALSFAASEYERLAKSAPTPDDDARVRDKAKRLREMSGPLPVPANGGRGATTPPYP